MEKQLDKFESKVAIVTGGSSGIGADTAVHLAGQGAAVVIAARNEEEGCGVVRRIEECGGTALFVKTDVTSSDDCRVLVDRTMDQFGRLDYAFNNAGVSGHPLPVAEFPDELWAQTMAVNLTGVFNCMKHQIPAMLGSGGGAIVNNASAAGLNAGKAPGSAYIASKHGVVGLTKAAAAEYAEQSIRVNAVCPAVIKTPLSEEAFADPELREATYKLHALGRIGETHEVSTVVSFLLSDEASFLTGLAVPVDGGFLLLQD